MCPNSFISSHWFHHWIIERIFSQYCYRIQFLMHSFDETIVTTAILSIHLYMAVFGSKHPPTSGNSLECILQTSGYTWNSSTQRVGCFVNDMSAQTYACKEETYSANKNNWKWPTNAYKKHINLCINFFNQGTEFAKLVSTGWVCSVICTMELETKDIYIYHCL